MILYPKRLYGKAIYLLLILLCACSAPQSPAYIEGGIIPVDSSTAPEKDEAVEAVISGYRAGLEDEMQQVIAYSEHTMEKDKPEGLLNNFIADLIMEMGRELYTPPDGKSLDFTLLNYGGLRTTIPEGPVTMARIFELMPFENEMVVITLSPEKTAELFEFLSTEGIGMPVSGIRIKTRDNGDMDVSIGGEPFDNTREYRVLTSDYLAGGGDNMVFFLDPLNEEYLGMRIRDAIIEYLTRKHEKGEAISSSLDGRFTIE